MNKYFVPGYGISRVVIQSQIAYQCGPDATVRPYSYQGRDGFLVLTPGPPLTQAQIDDLKEMSRKYEEQRSTKSGDQSGNSSMNRPVDVNHHKEGRGRR